LILVCAAQSTLISDLGLYPVRLLPMVLVLLVILLWKIPFALLLIYVVYGTILQILKHFYPVRFDFQTLFQKPVNFEVNSQNRAVKFWMP